jgi:hypothetical protein
MTASIAPWSRPAYRNTGQRAVIMLVAFADRDVLGPSPSLELRGVVPASAPTLGLDIRSHQRAADPDWFDGWRTGALRTIAEGQLVDLERLDRATHCSSVRVELDDPADLTHLQLAWAVATWLAKAGCFAVLDGYAINWLPGSAVAALPPDRPFAVQKEISLVAETEPTPGFGHAVHTRGMIKFARPDLIAGVPAERIENTGRILNHLARMLADGHVLTPGQTLRFDGERTLAVRPYVPDGMIPEVNISNEALLLDDVGPRA